ncbi:MAG: DNA repair protein RecN [Alphaproteobacteria bacterium]
MLAGLSIRDVVLIDRLDVAFAPGLCVLTGETGAGKSILLDALGLALGARAEARLVRQGAAQGTVTAHFDLGQNHPVEEILRAHGIAPEDSLLLRRVLGADGRSRAFVNDQPVSIGFLRDLGEALVEIEGQYDNRGLLDPGTHRAALDAFGGLAAAAAGTRAAWQRWRQAEDMLETARGDRARATRDADFLRHAVAELDELAPEAGEAAALGESRALLRNGTRIAEALDAAGTALAGENGAEAALHRAGREIERIAELAGGRLAPVAEALARAGLEAMEANAGIEALTSDLNAEPGRLETVEARLFDLRDAARKHDVEADALPALVEDFRARLDAVDEGDAALTRLTQEAAAARAGFEEAARLLSKKRAKAAKRLDRAIAGELPPLKLDKAAFATRIEELAPDQWSAHGMDRVAFQVATNPGAAPGPLARIASGGELARFTLALKVVLREASAVPTLVFDELDSGIGGATADAVGERLAHLAEEVQLLVVTHSPQVAARGDRHWRIVKDAAKAGDSLPRTRVQPLDGDARREEIARMLAGRTITAEARAAAARLIAGSAE